MVVWPLRKRNPRTAALVLCAGLLSCAVPAAATDRVLISLSADSEPYRRAAEEIVRHLAPHTALLLMPDDAAPDTDPGTWLITLGAQAAERALGRAPARQVAAMLSTRAYRALYENRSDAPAAALLIDQPLERQIAVLQRLQPGIRRVGVLVPEEGTVLELPAVSSLELVVRQVGANANLIGELELLLREVDALLALPEPGIYNRKTIHGVLLGAYRMSKPVIGYSRPMVEAGAVFSAYTSPGLLGEQAARLFLRVRKGKVPAHSIEYPRRFSIAVNPGIARALGLHNVTSELQERVYDDARQVP